VAVCVVHIRHVRVRVSHWLMLVMHVWMRMRENLMNMFVLMTLSQV
jgi:hypothetical protein